MAVCAARFIAAHEANIAANRNGWAIRTARGAGIATAGSKPIQVSRDFPGCVRDDSHLAPVKAQRSL